MTNRHSGYLVTLKQPIREDDAEVLMNAIRLLEPVGLVTPIESDVGGELIAQMNTKAEIRNALYEFIKEKLSV